VSERAGAAGTLVPEPRGITGGRFDPYDTDAIAASLKWMADLDPAERSAMGRSAASVVADWGPERFADGLVEAATLGGTTSTRQLALAS